MTIASNLGFPRMGRQRELKKALEAFWSGKIDEQNLLSRAAELKAEAWQLQKSRGIEQIPCNDFSLYDQVLDMTCLLGAVPARYRNLQGLQRYFAMARGYQREGLDLAALEMTKWFDTNYHYLVPEISELDSFHLDAKKILQEYSEAKAIGLQTRPVLLGPVSYLLLAKKDGAQLLRLLDRILPLYDELLIQLKELGAQWIQIDEPCLVLDLSEDARSAYQRAYQRLARTEPQLLLATYFGALQDNLNLATSLPISALHIDLVRAPEQAHAVAKALPRDCYLSLGLIDGRNIWRADLDQAYQVASEIAELRGKDRLLLAPSCSLLHCPIDLKQEAKLDAELKSWLAFALDKLDEVSVLCQAVDAGHTQFEAFAISRDAQSSRKKSDRVHNPSVQSRLQQLPSEHRTSPYSKRREAQKNLDLPLLPTTTIGSFPQTRELRSLRASYKAGKCPEQEYQSQLRKEIEQAVRWQEDLGIDVLVHGEFERNDMVEYFGEQLAGFAFTEYAWVQSYGSRCVKPPIIFGDISRPKPMTVAWSSFAQSLTKRPMKAMLTGPITILQWSFVRNDQSREQTCLQLALAIRDEVQDLEQAGLRIIQIDEAAIREGLPLRRSDWASYLEWAVRCFRLASSSVHDSTQIHTHMCYSEFNEIIEAVAAMDADVLSIETSRSKMELLQAFAKFHYPNEIGPGVYDIHSPRVPDEEEMLLLLRRAAQVLDPQQLWVNPDCGLKTRAWDEVRPALAAMVKASQKIRLELNSYVTKETSAAENTRVH